jgi:hypothetical protein
MGREGGRPKLLKRKLVSDGGAEGIRTPDPHNAIVVLYQLSYDPIQSAGVYARGPESQNDFPALLDAIRPRSLLDVLTNWING